MKYVGLVSIFRIMIRRYRKGDNRTGEITDLIALQVKGEKLKRDPVISRCNNLPDTVLVPWIGLRIGGTGDVPSQTSEQASACN